MPAGRRQARKRLVAKRWIVASRGWENNRVRAKLPEETIAPRGKGSNLFTTRPELTGTFGMVASTHWLASQSGMAILERGGNAFDAAVAAGFVLQVVEPHLNGPGGEVPIVGWDAGQDRPFVICGQGVAPARATIEAFHDLGLDRVPGTGLLPVCVPGAFGGWTALLARYGTMRLAEVLGYAIGYAERGFPLLPSISAAIGSVAGLFRAHWPGSAALWLRAGEPPAPGSRFANPELAATYTRILREAEAATRDRDGQIEAARRAFYEGFVAEALAVFAAETAAVDTTGEPHRGLLRYEDLAGWRASVEEPLTYDYRGYTLCKPGAWSQAPVFCQQLALLGGFDLEAMGPASPEYVHTVVEAAKLAFADREAFYGDPAFVDVPLAELLDPEYNARRRALISAAADTEGLRPGSPGGREPALPLPLPEPANGGTGEPTLGGAGGDTCHVDVVDQDGNMVAATPSGGWLQSSPAVPGLGFCLGTRGQMFWLDARLPNALAPGKRPRTTLSPSLALCGGEPYLAFGTPGGDQQDQWSLLLFLHHVHQGMSLQQAIDWPAWHTSHFPVSFYPRTASPGRVHVESRLGEGTMRALRGRGHALEDAGPWSLGRLSAVARGRDGLLRAAANPRGMQGYAVGR